MKEKHYCIICYKPSKYVVHDIQETEPIINNLGVWRTYRPYGHPKWVCKKHLSIQKTYELDAEILQKYSDIAQAIKTLEE